ncbi:cold-shock protein [Candidatus Woesearchaeota archaeon]|nr:cold-shock protein [Candidatus Woesearchaeota archaeon]
MEGIVKFFNRKKGFGFIHGDDEKDYFVHFTALPRNVFLRDNDRVSFEAVEGDRGLKADKVQLLQKGSERMGGEEGSAPRRQGEEASDEGDDGDDDGDDDFDGEEEQEQ